MLCCTVIHPDILRYMRWTFLDGLYFLPATFTSIMPENVIHPDILRYMRWTFLDGLYFLPATFTSIMPENLQYNTLKVLLESTSNF